MVVGVLEEPGVDLHLAREDRLQVVRHVVPGRDLRRARAVSSASAGMTPSSFWRANVRSRSCVPAVVERALVLVRPFGRDVVRRVRRTRREVHEERLVAHQRLLLADPVDGLVGHVLGEVIALRRGLVRLDRHRVLVDRRGVLVGLAADEAVEVLEARAGRPVVERAHRAGLPDRDLMALAELGGAVAVELEDFGERRGGVRAGPSCSPARTGRDLRDPAHADAVVVAAVEQGGARRRAQGGGVEAVVLQAVRPRGARPSASAMGPPKALLAANPTSSMRMIEHVRRAVRRTRGRGSAGTSSPGPWRRRSSGRRAPGRGWAAPHGRWVQSRVSLHRSPREHARLPMDLRSSQSPVCALRPTATAWT